MGVASEGGTKCGALSGNSDAKPLTATPTDSDLSVVIAAWPNVPPAVQAGIVAMVRAARQSGPAQPSSPHANSLHDQHQNHEDRSASVIA